MNKFLITLLYSLFLNGIGYAQEYVLLDWSTIHLEDVKDELERNKKWVDTLGRIIPKDDSRFKESVFYLSDTYTLYQKSLIWGNNYADVLDLMDNWVNILEDLYRKYDKDYIDSLLIDNYLRICTEYDIPNEYPYFEAPTLGGTQLMKLKMLIKIRCADEFDSAISELSKAIDPAQNEEHAINAHLIIAQEYMMAGYYIRAKDIYSFLLRYIHKDQETDEKYAAQYERCTVMLPKLAFKLGDIDSAYVMLNFTEWWKPVVSDYVSVENYLDNKKSLCELNMHIGDNEVALNHINDAYLAFEENKTDIKYPDIYEKSILSIMGDALYRIGRYDEAEKSLYKAISISHSNSNNDVSWPADSYMILSKVYIKQYKYSEAKNILIDVLEYYEKFTPEYKIGPLSWLQWIYYCEQNYVESAKYLSLIFDYEKETFNRQSLSLTSNELEMWWNEEWAGIQMYYGLGLHVNPIFNEIIYNMVVYSKGLLLRFDTSLVDFITESNDTRLIDLYAQLHQAYEHNDRQNILAYHRAMSSILEEYPQFDLLQDISHKDIASTLYTTDVAIEFVECWRMLNDSDSNAALILRKGWDAPKFVELCKIEELGKYYTEVYNTYAISSSSELYNLIWSKLEPYINDGDNVYFAPDGLLYQMNIEVLQDANGRRANEKWNLYRVSSTRELCMEKPTVDINSAVLYGGLKYTMDDDELLAASRTYSREDMQSATRGFVADSTMRKGWNYLPETKTEVESIAQMCESHNVRAEIFSETSGNEESFKALSGKKTPIIHLATHGFFYKNEEVTKVPFFNVFNFDQMPQKPDNSLKRSGLILAGGQKAWLGETIPDSVEDGILLAEEIATMDLTGTDLVVLSACETGLGEITSEGVFGLQRAFKKAGVQTIIMSLWNVNDLAASLFMRVFYHEWLSGKTKHEAFAIAQKTVRESYEGNDWAAFIMLD